MPRPVRTLLFSSLYPSAARPLHGIFVETRLRELLSSGAVQTKVVAPVPWFPSTHSRWGEYARQALTPLREVRHGIDVLHPRFAVLPKLGMWLTPLTLACAGLKAARQLQSEGFDFDLIDAHYFYPDGVAAAWLSRRLGKPLTITARGSDINLIGGLAVPRRMMLWASRQAQQCIGVSQALVDRMRALGMPGGRLQTMRNGVDLALFRPQPRAQARRKLGYDGAPLLLSVGNLLPLKGHDLCIDALAELLPNHPDARLLIAGSGPEAGRLRQHAQTRGVKDRVHLVGSIAHAELVHWYSAADVLLLASSREGWPNVLLEAMACGTPVIATGVGGVPELVCDGAAGRIVAKRSGSEFAKSVRSLLRGVVDREAVRRHAESFGWAHTTRAQIDLFSRLTEGRAMDAVS